MAVEKECITSPPQLCPSYTRNLHSTDTDIHSSESHCKIETKVHTWNVYMKYSHCVFSVYITYRSRVFQNPFFASIWSSKALKYSSTYGLEINSRMSSVTHKAIQILVWQISCVPWSSLSVHVPSIKHLHTCIYCSTNNITVRSGLATNRLYKHIQNVVCGCVYTYK